MSVTFPHVKHSKSRRNQEIVPKIKKIIIIWSKELLMLISFFKILIFASFSNLNLSSTYLKKTFSFIFLSLSFSKPIVLKHKILLKLELEKKITKSIYVDLIKSNRWTFQIDWTCVDYRSDPNPNKKKLQF